MEDFIKFRRMITPFIAEVAFIVVTLLIVGAGAFALGLGALQHDKWIALAGLAIMFVAPVIMRLWFEAAVVFFRMNETLTDLREVALRWRSELDRGQSA